MQPGFVEVHGVESLVDPESADNGQSHHLDSQGHQENEPELELVVASGHKGAPQELTNHQQLNNGLAILQIQRPTQRFLVLRVEC